MKPSTDPNDALMAREGHYYLLYQAQARNVDVEDQVRRAESEPVSAGDRE